MSNSGLLGGEKRFRSTTQHQALNLLGRIGPLSALAFTYSRCKLRRLYQYEEIMNREGVIAPDPSPQRTKTLTFPRGMNSRYEWTVFRETMSFYGAARDRLIRVEHNGENFRWRRRLDQLRADRG